MLLATHSGRFHTDDVFATAMLLLKYPNAQIIRSRDTEELGKADIRYDVGGQYNETTDFDHHQKEFTLEREGIPYSSCGLIWKHFGLDICKGNERMWQSIEEHLVRPIDAGDNGIRVYDVILGEPSFTIDSVIGSFHIAHDDQHEQVYQEFMQAVEFAKGHMLRLMRKLEKKYAEEVEMIQEVEAWKEEHPQKEYVVFSRSFMGSSSYLCKETEYKAMLSCWKDTWAIKCLRIKKDEFELRCHPPQEWCGKRDEELSQIIGIDDAVFCHKNGFLTVVKSYESAIKVVNIVVRLSSDKN